VRDVTERKRADAELRGRVEDDGAGFDPPGPPGGWYDDRGDGEPVAGRARKQAYANGISTSGSSLTVAEKRTLGV